MIVVCVLRTGGIYDAGYVRALRRGVSQFLPGLRFVCLTDIAGRVATDLTAPLEHNWPGWWSKMELFRVFPGPTLYFDLDTVLCGDLLPLAQVVEQLGTAEFLMLRDLNARRPDHWTSGVMGWNGDWGWMYDRFRLQASASMVRYRGDQEFIGAQLQETGAAVSPIQDHAKVASWKWRCRETAPPPGTEIVCFHGKPRPHEQADVPWMKEHWRPEP